MIFDKKEDQVIKEIEKTRSRIGKIDSNGTYHSSSIGRLSTGCRICTRMESMTFVLGYRCNARCDFCFADTYQASRPKDDEKYIRKSIFKDFLRRKTKINGIGFTGGETMLYMPEIEKYASIIRKEKPDIFFWVYTNGLSVDRESLKALKGYGIEEIRFNLAASDYSDKVIKKLGIAREIFKNLVVEVPAYPKQRQRLIDALEKLSYYSIDQLTLQEVLINANNIDRLDGEGYQSGNIFLKKYFLYGSRKLSYEVIDHCIDKKYAFTINECSTRRFGRVDR